MPFSLHRSSPGRLLVAVFAVVAAGTVLFASSASANANAQRGFLLSTHRVAHLGAEAVRRDVAKLGIAAEARYSVDAYRIGYRTVDPHGRPIRATGLLVLPQTSARDLPLAAYEHGTQSARTEAPSSATINDGYISALILGSSGLATSAPDYLGLGAGPGVHPYLDAQSEVTASVDMLRAARTFAARRGLELDRRVLVTGFSQGGAAAIALAHRLQNPGIRGWSLGALAPISGPYDLRRVELPAALDGHLDPAITPFYIAYLLTAWDRLHHVFPTLATVFRAPYDHEVRKLFDGNDDLPAVAAALPDSLRRLLTSEGLRDLHHPTGAFAAALRRSEVCRGWRPDVPVHLFAARGDHVVPIANASACLQALRRAGTTVTLTDVGDVGHDQSAFLAVPKVAAMFRGLSVQRALSKRPERAFCSIPGDRGDGDKRFRR